MRRPALLSPTAWGFGHQAELRREFAGRLFSEFDRRNAANIMNI
jgi:hypothetical protein